jgi:hypothetical protein
VLDLHKNKLQISKLNIKCKLLISKGSFACRRLALVS